MYNEHHFFAKSHTCTCTSQFTAVHRGEAMHARKHATSYFLASMHTHVLVQHVCVHDCTQDPDTVTCTVYAVTVMSYNVPDGSGACTSLHPCLLLTTASTQRMTTYYFTFIAPPSCLLIYQVTVHVTILLPQTFRCM